MTSKFSNEKKLGEYITSLSKFTYNLISSNIFEAFVSKTVVSSVTNCVVVLVVVVVVEVVVGSGVVVGSFHRVLNFTENEQKRYQL